MKMKLRAALATIAVVLYIASNTSPASACAYVDSTTDRCRNADLTVHNRHYRKGQFGHIDLPYSTREIYWYCGSSRERTAWGGLANRVTFYFGHDGAISWAIYKCSPMSGKYADDTTVYCIGDTVDCAGVASLNKALSELNNWCQENSLTPHSAKCEEMLLMRKLHIGPLNSVIIGDDRIDWVKHIRLLGVTIDDRLA
ncbi:hypothetical protein ACROYT_G002884 [Oculina patagonica]